ncbi:chemotaxis protein CheA [Bdellovibrio bacteriovorus]|uniref:chemotaxis protein CheA n=1 Tax=Bdellovibrio bacteriovorus TaxID=959 RepID=UPI0035A6CEC0
MSGDNAFFEELQMDFLNESAFMLEQYEEYMMRLENSENPVKDLTDIFRVAHSVKGGAAAVGLADLCKFAHVMEDLLDLLRSRPELVNSTVISLLLQSGDELKNRIGSLQQGQNNPWDPSALKTELVALTEQLSGKASKHSQEPAPSADEPKIDVPDDFFTQTPTAEAAAPAAEDDVTNHDLLAELLAQLSPEDQAEYYAKEEAEKKSAQPAPVATAEPVVAAPPTPVLKVVPSAPATPAPAATANGSNNGGNGKGAKNLNSTIKVDTGRVDSVLDAVGELVVLKNQLVHDETVRSGVNLRLEAIVDQLDKAVRELYEKTLSIRMTPLKSMFIKIQRIVRDVSLSLDKPVDLQLIGEETEVERTVFELLGDPLVHLVRNSMDHGVEKKELRQERGKSATAKVVVSAKQSGGNVIIDISDDGGGINREKVLAKPLREVLCLQVWIQRPFQMNRFSSISSIRDSRQRTRFQIFPVVAWAWTW